jgi:hypothetical protein
MQDHLKPEKLPLESFPTLLVPPEANLGPIPHLKTSKAGKFIPPFRDILPQLHPKESCGLKRAPPSSKILCFREGNL